MRERNHMLPQRFRNPRGVNAKRRSESDSNAIRAQGRMHVISVFKPISKGCNKQRRLDLYNFLLKLDIFRYLLGNTPRSIIFTFLTRRPLVHKSRIYSLLIFLDAKRLGFQAPRLHVFIVTGVFPPLLVKAGIDRKGTILM